MKISPVKLKQFNFYANVNCEKTSKNNSLGSFLPIEAKNDFEEIKPEFINEINGSQKLLKSKDYEGYGVVLPNRDANTKVCFNKLIARNPNNYKQDLIAGSLIKLFNCPLVINNLKVNNNDSIEADSIYLNYTDKFLNKKSALLKDVKFSSKQNKSGTDYILTAEHLFEINESNEEDFEYYKNFRKNGKMSFGGFYTFKNSKDEKLVSDVYMYKNGVYSRVYTDVIQDGIKPMRYIHSLQDTKPAVCNEFNVNIINIQS